MRRPSTLLAAALATTLATAALIAPARAQVQPGNPNAANGALASQGQARAIEQNQTTQNNMSRMNLERSQTAAPPPPGGMGAAPHGIR